MQVSSSKIRLLCSTINRISIGKPPLIGLKDEYTDVMVKNTSMVDWCIALQWIASILGHQAKDSLFISMD